MTGGVRDHIEAHPDATIVDADGDGRMVVEVPASLPSEIDAVLRGSGAVVTRKSDTRFEIQL